MAIPAPLPPEITVGVYQVAFQYRITGSLFVQTWQYRRGTGAAVLADLDELREAWRANKLAAVESVLPGVLVVDPILTVSALSDRTLPPSAGVPVLFGGGRAGTPDTYGAAAVVTMYSTFGGRSGRGRKFIGPICNPDAELGVLQPGFLTALNTFATTLRATMVGAAGTTFVPCIVSRRSPTTPATYKRAVDWTSFIVRTLSRSQRRRNVGIGPA